MDDSLDQLIGAALQRELDEAPDVRAQVLDQVARWERKRLAALAIASMLGIALSSVLLIWALPGLNVLIDQATAIGINASHAPYALTALCLAVLAPWLVALADDPI